MVERTVPAASTRPAASTVRSHGGGVLITPP
jgi:hypothetical protein